MFLQLRKMPGENKKIYARHKHILLGNCNSCPAREKIRWLEFRKRVVGNVLCGLAFDGCAVANGGSVH